MPFPTTRPSARTRALGLVSAGAVIAGLLAGVPAATAAGGAESAAKPAAASKASSFTRFTSGSYIVMLREPAAASYAGGNSRFAATRAKTGQQFRANSPRARAYTKHLRTTQRSLAQGVGAKVDRHFTIGLNGFSAKLTGKQAQELATDRAVLLVSKNVRRQADTWNTPDLLHLDGKKGVWAKFGGKRKAGAGVVIGDIDSGIWPESKSFTGRVLSSTPKTTWDISRVGEATRMEKADGGVFNGACELGDQWVTSDCNTKLIGARYYPDEFLASVPPANWSPTEVISTRDGGGHGTHTASTAAGNSGVSVKTEGIRFGEVSGMAPAARIAAYKVCFDDDDPNTGDCYTGAILSAIDDAIADGVDVINFSISGATDTVVDPVEVAFEGAAEAGIFVSASAGNAGPGESTVAHNSPWLTTVAASTHHAFENTLVLGNGKKIVGASISQTAIPSTTMVDSATLALAPATELDATLCAPDALDPAKTAGKMVVCTRGVYDRVAKSAEVKRAGGVAMVLANPGVNSLDADFHSVPTIHISDTSAAKVFAYLAAPGSHKGEFRLGNVTKKVTLVPQIGEFSSRGPALANDGDLLKPDIAAPGVSVLAAVAPPSNSGRKYDLYSGTSMAAPHITGLAAFMMSVHPQWTPMKVKSAMMTTAKRLVKADGTKLRDPFAQGSGNVNPRKFFDPGLFVTSDAREWRGFLTGQGLNTGVAPIAAKDVNVPSLAQGQVTSSTSFTRTFQATQAGKWKVSVRVPGFSATTAANLVTKRRGDLEDLTIEFTRTTAPLGQYATGYLQLSGPTVVRLPIALRPVSVKAPAAVSGTGVAGSVDVPITAGFTGNLDVGAVGLAQADTTAGTLNAGDFVDVCVEVDATSQLAQFDLDAANNAADLDLYVIKVDDTCSFGQYLAGQSATGSADEAVTLENPEPGFYIVEVDGFAAAPGDTTIDYALDFYDMNAAATLGGLAVTGNPIPVVNAVDTTFEATWSGLAPASRYLGLFTYEGALRSTFLRVTTAP